MAPYTGPTISLHVSITVAPENAEKFLEHLRPAYEAVIAEPRNTFFEVFRNPENPGQFRFVENWNCDKEWLANVQLKKEYYVPYIEATEPMWVKPREFEIFERMPGNAWVSMSSENMEKP